VEGHCCVSIEVGIVIACYGSWGLVMVVCVVVVVVVR
jgi:hypothetical protein